MTSSDVWKAVLPGTMCNPGLFGLLVANLGSCWHSSRDMFFEAAKGGGGSIPSLSGRARRAGRLAAVLSPVEAIIAFEQSMKA